MVKQFTEMAKAAEAAVRSIRDKELRKEAFRMLLAQLLSGKFKMTGRKPAKRKPGRKLAKKKAAKKRVTKKKKVKRPGRAGGGVVTTGLNKLKAAGYFRKQRDAATVYKELRRRRLSLEPSQVRMELLRFARSGKLKRKVKMKGKKVTYLYGIR
jgi:hypothetical protein